MKPIIYVDQKITAFVNRYYVYTATPSKGELVNFVEQKRGKIKEKVNFYTNKNKDQIAFTFRAEKVLDIHGKYFVEDPEGKLIGYFQKDFGQSFLKSTWYVFDSKDKKLLTVSESNSVLAILRRYLVMIPIVGEVLDIVTNFFKYHFDISNPETNAVVGKFEKLSIIWDKYLLSMDEDTSKSIDQRLLYAMAVALDALQSR